MGVVIVITLAFLLVSLTADALSRIRRSQSARWTKEAAVCTCGHGYYDHAHWAVGKPCGSLMCGCQWFRPSDLK